MLIRRWLCILIIMFSGLNSWAKPLFKILRSSSRVYIENLNKTPIDNILSFQQTNKRGDVAYYKHQLNVYRGLYEESVNLVNYCSRAKKSKFGSLNDKLTFLRSVVATTQYLGLDLTMRAITQYMHLLNYSEEEAHNVINNLLGNYCSRNLSLMSFKKFKTTFMQIYQSKQQVIATIKKNPFFPDTLDYINSDEGIYENELYYAVELFKSFCSWSGDPTDLKLLTPLLKSPLIYSALILNLIGKRMEWEEHSSSLIKVVDHQSKHVLCSGFMCRKVTAKEFEHQIPKMLGRASLKVDLQDVYCDYFATVNYQYPQSDKRIERMMKDRTDYDDAFLVAYFASLLTKIPDLLLRAKQFKDVFSYLNIPIEQHFALWAKSAMKDMEQYLYYEDALHVKKMPRHYYFDPHIDKFAVEFDVSLGEWDRAVYKDGKLQMSFDIYMPRELLRWVKQEFKFLNGERDDEIIDEVHKRVAKQISVRRIEVQKKLNFPLWNERIDNIIAHELIEQVLAYRGEDIWRIKKEMIKVPITFYIGAFALKYIYYQYKVDRSQKELTLTTE